MLTITHTHETGTIIEGTSRGDGAAPILQATGWRWGRSIAAWYIPHSRDRLPKPHAIARTAAALRAAGFNVTQDLDLTSRSAAEVEHSKAERQAARAEALSAKAERKQATAVAAEQAHRHHVATLPPAGEPIKIGHHSEQRHRNAVARAHASMGRAVQAHAQASEATHRAEVATRTTSARHNPVTVANRIENLAAETRRIRRELDGHTTRQGTPYAETVPPATGQRRDYLNALLTEQSEALTYWQAVRAAQIESGEATNYSAQTVTKGDAVKIRGHWHRVARANPKTVSVEVLLRPETGYTVTRRSPWAEVQDHRPAHP